MTKHLVFAGLVTLLAFMVSLKTFLDLQQKDKSGIFLSNVFSTQPQRLNITLAGFSIGHLDGLLTTRDEGYEYNATGNIRLLLKPHAPDIALDFSIRLAINGLHQIGASIVKIWHPSNPQAVTVIGTTGIDLIEFQLNINTNNKMLPSLEDKKLKLSLPGPLLLYPTSRHNYGIKTPFPYFETILTGILSKISYNIQSTTMPVQTPEAEALSNEIKTEMAQYINGLSTLSKRFHPNNKSIILSD